MILVANDAGSKELLSQLQKRVEASLDELEFGDFIFQGVGPGNSSIDVAVERKTWSDLIGSVESGRLITHQIPGMLRDFDRQYLLVEGIVRASFGGVVEMRYGKGWRPLSGHSSKDRGWKMGQLRGVLMEIEEVGIRIVYTANQTDTCEWLAAAYRFWQKPFEEHSLFKRVKETRPQQKTASLLLGYLEQDSTLRKAVAQFDGIGWEKAKAVEEEFGTIREMANADVKRWKKVHGIGKVLAERVVRIIEEGE